MRMSRGGEPTRLEGRLEERREGVMSLREGREIGRGSGREGEGREGREGRGERRS